MPMLEMGDFDTGFGASDAPGRQMALLQRLLAQPQTISSSAPVPDQMDVLARILGQGPTVGSTGGASPALLPATTQNVPVSAAPPGAIPQMGLGEGGEPPASPVVPSAGQPMPPAMPAAAPVPFVNAGMLNQPAGATAQMPLTPPPAPTSPMSSVWPLPPPIAVAPPPPVAGVRPSIDLPRPGGDGMDLPPNSAPATNIPPQQAGVMPTSTGPIPDTSLLGRLQAAGGDIQNWIGNHRNTLMALGAGLAGAQSLGQGLNRGGTMAMAAQQMDIKQQAMNQTVNALVQRGVPADMAMGIATNPAILQQMLPQLFGVKQRQFTQIGEDMLGNKKFGFVDPVQNKVYDMTGNEITAGAAGSSAGMVPTGADGMPMHGQELLAHLEKTDPITAAGVKSILAGDSSVAGRNLQKLAPVAALVDPTFDATQFPIRLATRKNYTSGKQFQEIQAINTVAGHLDNLSQSADALNNFSGLGPLNMIANQGLAAWRGMTQDPRIDKFNTDMQAVTSELGKAYQGGHVTESQLHMWQDKVSAAKSPDQLKAVIGEMNDLLNSKRQALEDGYRSSMGPAPLPGEFSAESTHAKQVFGRVADWAHGVRPAPTPATPTAGVAPGAVVPPAPPPGRYVWTPDRGLQPAQ